MGVHLRYGHAFQVWACILGRATARSTYRTKSEAALTELYSHTNLLCIGLAKPRGPEVAAEVASPIQSPAHSSVGKCVMSSSAIPILNLFNSGTTSRWMDMGVTNIDFYSNFL